MGRLTTPLTLILFGIAIAFLASMCGIGGGLFAVPILHYLYGLPLRRAVASSLLMVFATASTSTIAEVSRADSALRWDVVLALVITSLIGAQLGYRTARRLEPLRLKVIFAVVLLLVGFRILLIEDPPTDSLSANNIAHTLTTAEIAMIAAFGLLAGFVSPLLGIGGGLVAVPALFLGIPSLGYLGARACSLAMGALNSARSVWLYRRDGELRYASAGWIAVGAILGALIGVWTVHHPGAQYYARVLMGLILCFVSLRFGLDVWRARARA